jgi:hypothetical protein
MFSMYYKIIAIALAMAISGCPSDFGGLEPSNDVGNFCRFCIEKEVNIKQVNGSTVADAGN